MNNILNMRDFIGAAEGDKDHIQVIASNLPPTIYGILGALVLWPICRKLKLDGYVDRQTISSIRGLSVDLLVLSAVGTLNLRSWRRCMP